MSINSNSVSNVSVDLHGATLDFTSDYYRDIGEYSRAFSNAKEGETITLSNGMEIDPNSLTGMTVFQVHINVLNAFMEFMTNLYTFVKSFEQKLNNSLS
ncbi:hypothetical protein DID77_00045 [Candidatus Marinamargulisbacteria bacterium SCGC AG-439-L15]|nr:hypothetical protein DID77_00045 [Candidatus Marinamargulisbacteria bacterium SCGC AG-439-L15]